MVFLLLESRERDAKPIRGMGPPVLVSGSSAPLGFLFFADRAARQPNRSAWEEPHNHANESHSTHGSNASPKGLASRPRLVPCRRRWSGPSPCRPDDRALFTEDAKRVT